MSHYKPYPAYKDSGVEWIGKVPKHWDVVKIKHAAQLATDRHNAIPSGLQYIGLEDVESGSGQYKPTATTSRQSEDSTVGLFQSGDVLYGKLRPYLRKCITVQTGGVCSTEFLVLKPSSTLPAWLQNWLLTHEVTQQVEAGCDGAKMPRADWEHVGAIHIPAPGKSEQLAILENLNRETTRIDALIAKKAEFIELLAKKRQTLITNAVTKGLNPKVKMKDSGVEWIGEVPDHWTVKRLKHLIEEPLQYGANESGDSSIEDGPRYIRITDLDDAGALRNNSVKRLSWDMAQPYMLNDGDILFARSGATVGKTYRYKSEHGSACFAGYLIRARLDRKIANPDFVILAVRSHYYWAYIQRTTIQATIENVGAERYGDFPVAVPDCDEQERIVAAVSSALTRIDLLVQITQDSISLLKKRRSALINAAVTGQIDLRESA